MVFQAIKPRWLRTPKVVSTIQASTNAIHQADRSEKVSLLAGFIGRQAKWLHVDQAKVAESDPTLEVFPNAEAAEPTDPAAIQTLEVKDHSRISNETSSPESNADAGDSTSTSETLCIDQQVSVISKRSSPWPVTDIADGRRPELQWEAIMQLSFLHFKEQEALKALLLSREISHRNQLKDLQDEAEQKFTLVHDEAQWKLALVQDEAQAAFEQQRYLSLKSQQAAEREKAELEQKMTAAADQTRTTVTSLQTFKQRNEHLTEALRGSFEQTARFENDLNDVRMELERRARRIRELEWDEHRLQRVVRNMRNEQDDANGKLQELAEANRLYVNFVESFEQGPEDAHKVTNEIFKQVAPNCEQCIYKEKQNRMLREVNHCMAEKIVETRHAVESAKDKLASIQDLTEDSDNEKKIRAQELIALQEKQLSDLRIENSAFAVQAKEKIHILETEKVAMQAKVARLETALEAKDAELALANHGASQVDSLRRKLAVVIDMATKRQNERQVRKSVEVLNRERHSFKEELTTLNAHSEAYKALLSKTSDELIEAKIQHAEACHANAELQEAHDVLEKKWEILNIKHEETTWKTEYHDDVLRQTSARHFAEIHERNATIADLQTSLNEIMAHRPADATAQALDLLDMERETCIALKQHAQLQKDEIDRLNQHNTRYGFYARSYEILAAHMDYWQHRIQSCSEEVSWFDAALLEEVGAIFGVEGREEVRARALRRFEGVRVRRGMERASAVGACAAGAGDGVVGEEGMGQEEGGGSVQGKEKGKERAVEKGGMPSSGSFGAGVRGSGSGSGSWETSS